MTTRTTPIVSSLLASLVAAAGASCATPALRTSLAPVAEPLPETSAELAASPFAEAFAAAAVATPTPPAQAGDAFAAWCLALSGGYTCVDSSSGDFPQNDVDETDTGLAISAAWRPHRYVSFELGYQDLGKETYTDVSTPGFTFKGAVETQGYYVAAVGYYPITKRIDAIGRLGAFMWDSEDAGVTVVGGGGAYSDKDDGAELTYGLGLQASIWGPLAARLEYQRIDGIKFDNYWLGLLWSF